MILGDKIKKGFELKESLKPIEKTILSILYLCQINGENPLEIIVKKSMLPKEQIKKKIDELVENQLVNDDKYTLTEIGRNSLQVVLAGGVFDIIHPGHIYTLNAAKALGDILVVVVATDNTSVRMKKRKPLHSQKQRQELVESLSMVDLCLVGQEDDMFKTVNRVRPQIIALGYDQVHQEKFIKDGCKRIELEASVARLQSPIPDSSSSKIQKEYGKSIYGI